jgi:DNA-binding GntR family transcriptional regulator
MQLSQEAKNQINRPVVLAEQITTILQNSILDGSLKEGERLIEAEMQKLLAVSRSPLREAFRELEKRGFVEIVPRRGTFVRRITERDIIDSMEVRLTLEVQAATLAYSRAKKTILKKMIKIVKQMEKAVRIQDNHTLSALHTHFHNSYIDECGNEVLKSFLENIYFRTSFHHSSFYLYNSEDFEDWLLDHQLLLTEFQKPESKNKDLKKVIQEHINSGIKEYLDLFKVLPGKR